MRSKFLNYSAKIVKVEHKTKKKLIFFFFCRDASYLRRSQRYEKVSEKPNFIWIFPNKWSSECQ